MYKLLLILICLLFCLTDHAQELCHIIGGQVYSSPHHSTQTEFAERKQLYAELVHLANTNRQRASITLHMKEYRSIAEKVWNRAYQLTKGQIRAIPICEELIPPEAQTPQSTKEAYYKKAAGWHRNYCHILKELNELDRNICLYFSLSTEVEMLSKPLYDLSPATIYTLNNLRGRMKYLRRLYPERSRVGKLISEGYSGRISGVNTSVRQALKYNLERSNTIKEQTYFPAGRMKHYNEIAVTHFRNIKLLFGNQVDFYPVSEPYLLPLEYIDVSFWGLPPEEKAELEKKRNAFAALHKPRYQNFCNYIAALPALERTICLYVQRIRLRYLVEQPIRDLATDTPYPESELRRRLQTSRDLTRELLKLKQSIDMLEQQNKKEIQNEIKSK